MVASGPTSFACAGEMSTFKSVRLGIAGLVVDGSVTGALEMEAVEFPCFARYHTHGPTHRRERLRQASVTVGGVRVNPAIWCLQTTTSRLPQPRGGSADHRPAFEMERKEVEVREPSGRSGAVRPGDLGMASLDTQLNQAWRSWMRTSATTWLRSSGSCASPA